MTTIFKGGKLIDGQSDDVINNALIVVEDARISYAGELKNDILQKYTSEKHTVIDTSNKTIMPGMIDAHVHLTMYGKPSSVLDFLSDTQTYTALKAADCAKKLLFAGFTTVRSMGDKSEADFAVRRAVQEGMIVGSKIIASGKAISITGGHGDFVPGDAQLDTIGETCDGVDEVRRATRKRLKCNADNIKLMATGGGNSPGPGTISQLSIEEMRVAVEEANNRGVCTSAHCIGEQGIKNAIIAGVRTIEHGSFLDDEAIEMMIKGNRYLVPTICAFRTIKYGAEGGVPPHVIDKVKLFATQHYSGLQKAIKAGVKIVCGTDTGTPFNYHGMGAEELVFYVENGMTPIQAIHSATSVAAEALLQKDIGILASGYCADLLLVEGNPLDDIEILQDANKLTIYQNGKLIIK